MRVAGIVRRRKGFLRFIVVLFVLLIASSLMGLTFNEVMDAADNNFDLNYALLEVDRLEAEVQVATQPDDLRFAFNPALKVLTEIDGGFRRRNGAFRIYLSFDTLLPLRR